MLPSSPGGFPQTSLFDIAERLDRSRPLIALGSTLAPHNENLTLEANNFMYLTPEPVTPTVAEPGNWELFIGYALNRLFTAEQKAYRRVTTRTERKGHAWHRG